MNKRKTGSGDKCGKFYITQASILQHYLDCTIGDNHAQKMQGIIYNLMAANISSYGSKAENRVWPFVLSLLN